MDEVYATEENFQRNFSLPGYSVYGRDTRDANELLWSYSVPRYFDNETPLPNTWDSGWMPPAMSYLDKMSAGR